MIKNLFKNRINQLFLILLLIFIPNISFADDYIPKQSEFKINVYDETNSLTEDQIRHMNDVYKSIKKQTGGEVVVIVKKDIDMDIDQYRNEAFKSLGIGEKGKDNGLLLVVDVNGREIAIETGYETEGFITDIDSSHVIDKMAEVINNQSMGDGIVEGFDRLCDFYQKEYQIDIDQVNSYEYDDEDEEDSSFSPLKIIITLCILYFFFKHGGPFIFFGGPFGGFGSGYFGGFSGRSSGGGYSGGSFGGGRSGGGGASGKF